MSHVFVSRLLVLPWTGSPNPGSALWSTSSAELKSLETTFNNILRRIWSLPRMCHTGKLHKVAHIYNVVIRRSSKLLSSALQSNSLLIREVFHQSSKCVNTSLGYNAVFGYRHEKIYRDQDVLCANFIRDARLAPELNSALNDEIVFICTT